MNVQQETRICSLFSKKPKIIDSLRQESKVSLVCNLLQMTFNPKDNYAQQYSVKITPQIANDNNPLRNLVFKQIAPELKTHFYPYCIAGYTIFTSNKHIQGNIKLETKANETTFTIEIEHTHNKINLSEICSNTEEAFQVLSFVNNINKNILLVHKHLLRFDNQNYFNYMNVSTIEQNTSFIMPGFSSSAVITESGLLLRINDKNKFLSGKTAYEKIYSLRREYKDNNSFLKEVNEYFSNKSVIAKYGNYRVYKIDSVTFDKNCTNIDINVKGADGNTEVINLYNYYKMQYGIEIKDKTQPLLVHCKHNMNNSDTIYLIPELCLLTGIDDSNEDNHKMNLRKNTTSKTKLNPYQKLENIKNIKKYFENTEHKVTNKGKHSMKAPDDIRHEYGLRFKELLTVNGRELEPPKIMYNNTEVKPFNGRFRGSRLINPKHLSQSNWICVTSRANYDNAEQMIMSLKRASKELGVIIDTPKFKGISAHKEEDFISELKSYENELKNKQIVLIILDKYSASYYAQIKNYLNTKLGVASQCMRVENKSKNLSYYSNVVNQMVVKIKGELYNIEISPKFRSVKPMIIGVDVCRCKNKKLRYVMVSSYNQLCSRYISEERECEDVTEEKEFTISYLLKLTLTFYNKVNGGLPGVVLIYRNGGNLKQKEKLFQEELTVFKRMFCGNVNEGGFQDNYIPIYNYIVVNKKTELKFFQVKKENHHTQINNPQNGTVIDTDVVHPDFYEFYLQPQYVNSGTATPVHYHCLFDSTKMPFEKLESITYMQTYYYWNWPGPIREPAALKYAEKCNEFYSKYLSSHNVCDNLKDSPFYI